MATKYKEKLLKEIAQVPDETMPNLYRIFHVLKAELARKTKKGDRGSLRGIWGNHRIDEPLFHEAKNPFSPTKVNEVA